MKFGKSKHHCSPQKKKAVLYFLALILLLLSFQGNIFSAASDHFFKGHQRDSEALVLGRLIETSHNGYFSQGGFLGRYADKDSVKYQYEAYEEGLLPESTYRAYTSSAGLQGFFYGVTDTFLGAVGLTSGKSRFFINKLITSFALASLVAFLIVFAYAHLGLTAAMSTLLLSVYSQWLVVFSNNLYWMFFLVVLPFCASLFLLSRDSSGQKKLSVRSLCSVVFISILVKSFAGYEYMSTIFISMVVPFLFFSIKDSWEIGLLAKRVLLVSISALSGFLTAILLHIAQLSYFLGSFSKGLDGIWATVLKRTHGNPDGVPEIYRRSLESSVFEVLVKYWNGVAFDLHSIFGFVGAIRFGDLILFAMAISVVGLLLVRAQSLDRKRLTIAVLASTWFSILAPLSWYVLAKGHSYIHTNMNHVLWYVPFLFLVFAYIGFFFELLIRWSVKLNLVHRILVIGSVIVFSCAWGGSLMMDSYNRKQNLVDASSRLAMAPGNELSVSVLNSGLIFSSSKCGENLSTAFFLHLVPRSIAQLPQSRKRYGFDNFDFIWSQKQVAGQSRFIKGDVCVATVSLPVYPLQAIRTGQFNKDGRLWESYIDLSEERFASEVQAFNLTDGNWVKGVSRNHSGFFVLNTFENRQSLRVGDTLKFGRSGERVVQQITYSARYINVFVSGDRLEPEGDGFPQRIGIVSKARRD